MAKIVVTSVSEARSVLDLINDSDNFTMGLNTGYMEQEDPCDHLIDIFGLIEGGTFAEVTPTESDMDKYMCNPYLLSYDLYGTIDYGAILLYINGISHPGDFKLNSKILILNKSNIKQLYKLYGSLIKLS